MTLKIDVIIPTYNRAKLLPRAIDSALAAVHPPHTQLRFLVVDNNSSDSTAQVIRTYTENKANQVYYLFEAKQGRHHALNTGIADSSADILAFFDDDERIASNWLECIVQAFSEDDKLDYLGGPVRPDWAASAPDWLPLPAYGGVLGIIDNGPKARRYGEKGFEAMPTGGNFAIRKTVLDRCGPYSPEFMYHEDLYLYKQLIKLKAKGLYLPALEVFHCIPPKRLSKAYFRHWAYNEGFNHGKLARTEPLAGRAFLGAPLWKWRQSLLALGQYCSWRPSAAQRFKAELDLWQFWGFYLGKNGGVIGERYVNRA